MTFNRTESYLKLSLSLAYNGLELLLKPSIEYKFEFKICYFFYPVNLETDIDVQSKSKKLLGIIYNCISSKK